MSSLVLKSAAKVNLYLKVLNQREDGFHNIETLFQRIDLCDELTFHKNASGRITITCSHPHVPEGPKNLVYKVAQKFKDDFGIKEGIHIDIKKSIPVAAGLAGGSTNAATALIALNQLWDIGLTRESLVEYAIGIGSDVAFFLYDTSFAIGTDRGHVLETVDIKQKYYYILVTPKIKVYAKDAYQELALSRKIA
ncbi:MAG: 4-diphosphocytidyl-2-C-methyl-D-erythritol kinase, partial [Lysobacterales bacterium]